LHPLSQIALADFGAKHLDKRFPLFQFGDPQGYLQHFHADEADGAFCIFDGCGQERLDLLVTLNVDQHIAGASAARLTCSGESLCARTIQCVDVHVNVSFIVWEGLMTDIAGQGEDSLSLINFGLPIPVAIRAAAGVGNQIAVAEDLAERFHSGGLCAWAIRFVQIVAIFPLFLRECSFADVAELAIAFPAHLMPCLHFLDEQRNVAHIRNRRIGFLNAVEFVPGMIIIILRAEEAGFQFHLLCKEPLFIVQSGDDLSSNIGEGQVLVV
jgi:hypothetical protein